MFNPFKIDSGPSQESNFWKGVGWGFCVFGLSVGISMTYCTLTWADLLILGPFLAGLIWVHAAINERQQRKHQGCEP